MALLAWQAHHFGRQAHEIVALKGSRLRLARTRTLEAEFHASCKPLTAWPVVRHFCFGIGFASAVKLEANTKEDPMSGSIGKRAVSKLAVQLSSLGLIAAALAIAVPKAQSTPSTETLEEWQLQDFDHFLNHHPAIRVDLFHDPFLSRDPAWRANHRDFDRYLAKHPGIREQFQMDPGNFVGREGKYEHWRVRR